MICVYALSTVKAGKAEEFIKLAMKLVEETRKEKGCLSYEFGKLCEEGNSYAFVERWESIEALEGHFRTPHYEKILPMMKEFKVGNSKVSKIEVL